MLFLEVVASVVSIVGVSLISSKSELSKYGWWICLLSNLLWYAYGVQIEALAFTITQLMFLITSLNGIHNNFFLKKNRRV